MRNDGWLSKIENVVQQSDTHRETCTDRQRVLVVLTLDKQFSPRRDAAVFIGCRTHILSLVVNSDLVDQQRTVTVRVVELYVITAVQLVTVLTTYNAEVVQRHSLGCV